MNTKTINIQVLAYLGDAVFSLYIREKLISLGLNNADKIQKISTKYVSAKGQVDILKKLVDNNKLLSEEIDIIKKGRNNKRSSHPKNTELMIYKLSTGFEALIGSLYINNKKRLEEILNEIEVK